MRRLIGLSTLVLVLAASAAQAGNQSSNSSSNSSNGFHTRVDTLVSDDGRGRRFYERRFRSRYDGYPGYRVRFRERGYGYGYGFRERGYRYRDGGRRWRGGDDDD